jgi:hypothetical protein
LKSGEKLPVVAIDGVPIEQWRASRARSRSEKDWRFKK